MHFGRDDLSCKIVFAKFYQCDKTLMIIKVSTAELKVGMYIHKLDSKWLSTPFLRHSFRITSDADIIQLQKLTDFVSIDTSKSTGFKLRKSEFGVKEVDIANLQAHIDNNEKLLRLVFEDLKNSGVFHQYKIRKIINSLLLMVFRNEINYQLLERLRNHEDTISEKSVRLALLTIVFAKYIGLKKELIMDLATGAILHDIGMIKIDREILDKTSINESERAIIQSHVELGGKIVDQVYSQSSVIRSVIYQHHELLDGSGYPLGLKSSSLHLPVRIISLISIYEAMTRNRKYAPAVDKFKAVKELASLAEAGKVDRRLLAKFASMLSCYSAGMKLVTFYNEIVVFQKYSSPELLICRCADSNILKTYSSQSIISVVGV